MATQKNKTKRPAKRQTKAPQATRASSKVKPKTAKARAKKSAPRAAGSKSNFEKAVLKRLLVHAKAGDAHGILGMSPAQEIRKALESPPEWGKGSYEKLLALYVACDHFGHSELNGVIYDFAEHTYFRYDDEGYLLAQLNGDLAAIHGTKEFGLFDKDASASYLEASAHVE